MQLPKFLCPLHGFPMVAFGFTTPVCIHPVPYSLYRINMLQLSRIIEYNKSPYININKLELTNNNFEIATNHDDVIHAL